MEAILQKKAQLRSLIKQKRSQISSKDYELRNSKIFEFVRSFIEEKNAKHFHMFISMNDRYEVNTHPIIEFFLINQLKVSVPIMDGESLKHCELQSLLDLETNKWGVLEPKVCKESTVQSFEIIFIPLLGVDLMGNRLGYGKGYYDRFLETTKALKIGLLFSDFIFDEIPVENHDIKLDGIITEKGVRLM